jgi:glycosyltransferase involved in cell wall biosynthesis
MNCPESYSEPSDVYRQAKQRGMDFVTITDHDSLEGVLKLSGGSDVIVGEEVTCYFPEDHCKIHLLVWGLDSIQHAEIQAVANDIYQVAEHIESRNLAHSVAHPVYRQNDVLERWHLERLALMFKGFECLNGAHSALHREALEPFVDSLTPQYIETLSRRHNLSPRWPEPWIKARTAGSDDHGLFNVGRTWTEFPADASTVPAILQCIREARCQPAGEAGSSMKLAHNFFGVGIRYYARQIAGPESAPAKLLGMLTGEHPSRFVIAVAAVQAWTTDKCSKIVRALTGRIHAPAGTALLFDILGKSIFQRLGESPVLKAAMKNRAAPLAEHAAMFNLVSGVNRDVAEGIRQAVAVALKDGCVGPVFDAISAVAAHQFVMIPYYFALFHQNRERHVLERVTGHARPRGRGLRVGLFTDTLDEINGVGRFIRVMAGQAQLHGASLTVHTCNKSPLESPAWRKNFEPLVSLPMPMYERLTLTLPPILDVLEWADRQQFDAIHLSTPGPMGMMGWLVAKMLRIPVLGVYHTDFPLYVERLTGDYRLTSAATAYMQWFYAQAAVVFSRSRSYLKTLEKRGVENGKLRLLPPSVDSDRFNPDCRDAGSWLKLGVKEAYRILYVGRVSAEKNLPLLVESFKLLCATRRDAALVIVGDGPYLCKMRDALAGLPAYFLGFQDDASLRVLYASSDLFAFPSRTDTLGQVVMEAQACGLPVLVSDEGGPREMMDDGLSGLVLPGADAAAWSRAMADLLDDAPLRQRMARTAPLRMARYSRAHAFESFWAAHVAAADNVAAAKSVDAVSTGVEQLTPAASL